MIRLHSSDPPAEVWERIAAIKREVKLLRVLTMPEVRAVYDELEATRDMLSQILDRADGKLR